MSDYIPNEDAVAHAYRARINTKVSVASNTTLAYMVRIHAMSKGKQPRPFSGDEFARQKAGIGVVETYHDPMED